MQGTVMLQASYVPLLFCFLGTVTGSRVRCGSSKLGGMSTIQRPRPSVREVTVSEGQAVDATVEFDERFDIAASEITARQRRALKSEDTFAIVDAHGDINAEGTGSDSHRLRGGGAGSAGKGAPDHRSRRDCRDLVSRHAQIAPAEKAGASTKRPPSKLWLRSESSG